MAKSKDYFSHDYHARTDLRSIQKDMGLEGVGLYWCLVEILHESGGSIKLSELEGIAYELHIPVEQCEKLIRDYDKFTIRNEKITCSRVTKNLKKREELSKVRQAAANERWSMPEGEKSPSDENNTTGIDVEWHKWWFSERLDKQEAKADVNDSIWKVRGYITNVIEAVAEQETLTIDHKKITTADYLETIKFFVITENGMRRCVEVIDSVNEKSEKGKIRNKLKYLISALYQAVKANGG